MSFEKFVSDYLTPKEGGGVPYLGLGEHTLLIESVTDETSKKDQTTYRRARFVVLASTVFPALSVVQTTWDVYAAGWKGVYEKPRFGEFFMAAAGTQDHAVLRKLFDKVLTDAQPLRGRTVKCDVTSQPGKNNKVYMDRAWSSVDADQAQGLAYLNDKHPMASAPAVTLPPALAALAKK